MITIRSEINDDVATSDAWLNLSFGNLRRVLHEEVGDLKPRLLLAQALMRILPLRIGRRVRAQLLRQVGFQIGHGTLFLGAPCIVGSGNIYSRLMIGQHCYINIGCLFDLEDHITVGNRVGFGHDVMVLTSTHELGSEKQRVGDLLVRAVNIGDGCWIGARATILPGVTIGRGSVIAAGTVVNRDVPPNTVVSGTQRMSVDRWMLFLKNGNQTAPPTGAGR